MALRLNGQTSGYVELDVPAAAGSHTLTLPDSGGTSGQYLQTNGSGTLSWQTVSTSNLTRTSSVTASGETVLDFENIPSGVRRITIIFDSISWNNGNEGIVQIGDSGGLETTGYTSNCGYFGPAQGTLQRSNGFVWATFNSSSTFTGHMVITNLRDNLWVSSHTITRTNDFYTMSGGGRKELSGTLDRLRITVDDGSSTYDAGSVSVFYEV